MIEGNQRLSARWPGAESGGRSPSLQAQNQPVHFFATSNAFQLAQEMPPRRIWTALVIFLRIFLMSYLRFRNECVMGAVDG